MNETLQTIMTRFSCRHFSGAPITDEQITILLQAAMAAPTAENKQPWDFIVIRDKNTLTALSNPMEYSKMTASAEAAILVCGNLDKAMSGFESGYWVQDCAAATENLLLAAHSLGLGACWTAVHCNQPRVDFVRELFHLPDTIIPLNIIPIGIPARPDRTPLDKYKPKNIHWEQW